MAAGRVEIDDIPKIAGHLPSWTLVATKLDMGEEDIQEIQASSKVAANQRKEFLKKWITQDPEEATYERLCTVLVELGEKGAAEKIRAIGRKMLSAKAAAQSSESPDGVHKQASKPPSPPETLLLQQPVSQTQTPSQTQPDAKLGHQPPIQQPSVGSSSVGLGPPSGEVPVQEQILKLPSQPQPSAKLGLQPPIQQPPVGSSIHASVGLGPPIQQPSVGSSVDASVGLGLPSVFSSGSLLNTPDYRPAFFWQLQNLRPLDGTGLTIAILDSGIKKDHTNFNDRIKEAVSFIDSDSYDFNGHGTTCASIAAGGEQTCTIPAGTADGKQMWREVPWKGVAPGAKIVVYKVTNSLSVDKKFVVKALHFLINKLETDNNYVDVLSLAFGFEEWIDEMADCIKKLKQKGVIIVCSAGNHGHTSGVLFPARMTGDVLCIGAHNEYGMKSRLTPKGQELDFLAPGENIWAPIYSDQFSLVSAADGTSYSASAVAGLICLILQHVKKQYSTQYNEAHNVRKMKEILKTLSSNKFDEEKGFGPLDPLKLLKHPIENVLDQM